MNTRAPKKPVTVRLEQDDVAFLNRVAARHALTGEKLNLSRALRVIVKKARNK